MSELALAVDIGGTKILVGLVDKAGQASALEQVPTPAREGADAIIAAVLATTSRVREKAANVVACGVGTAGVVGHDGEITTATDLLRGWAGTPLRARLAAALGLPVAVLNDVQATGLGEARIGAAAGHAAALIVAVGTGIGGAIVRDGRVLHGAVGIAGSVGHMLSPLRRGTPCSCGAVDHIEGQASGPGMAAEYQRRTGEAVDLRVVAERAGEGDAVARAVLIEGAEALGAVIGSANNLADADVVVIGGGVLSLGEMFLGPLRAAARAQALGASRDVPILAAALGPQACLVGAGLAGLDLGH